MRNTKALGSCAHAGVGGAEARCAPGWSRGENPFGRQPAVTWQGPFFLRNNTSLMFVEPVFVISMISGHEKDAQCDLEKIQPIFAP